MIANLNRYFDHTNLNIDASEKNIERLCDEALKYDFYSVVVNPVWVSFAKKYLQNSNIKITSVAGYPLGANRTDLKILEAVKAVNDGADEIDMVANVGHLVSNQFSKVEDEIKQIRQKLPYNIILKVIIEAGKLTESQQISSVELIIDGGAQFVKTSTGFFGGATKDQIERLHKAANDRINIKASGEIRTLNDCLALINNGAVRIGSSSSVKIMEAWLKSAKRK